MAHISCACQDEIARHPNPPWDCIRGSRRDMPRYCCPARRTACGSSRGTVLHQPAPDMRPPAGSPACVRAPHHFAPATSPRGAPPPMGFAVEPCCYVKGPHAIHPAQACSWTSRSRRLQTRPARAPTLIRLAWRDLLWRVCLLQRPFRPQQIRRALQGAV